VASSGGQLRLQTPGHGAVIDITEGVRSVVRTTAVHHGLVVVFALGATVAITTIEHEPGAVRDLQVLLEELIPAGGAYQPDTNAHAHLRAALIGASESVPIVDGALVLGVWQQLVLLDFDDRARDRIVQVQVLS
jgi:secondary thiamine-phosphate synthase enzyme